MSSDKPKTTPEEEADFELRLAYHEMSEDSEIGKALTAHRDAPDGPTETIAIEVQKRTLDLLNFLEAKAAETENRAPRPIEQLVAAAVSPRADQFDHPTLRALWNSLCDEYELPNYKLTAGDRLPPFEVIFGPVPGKEPRE